MTIPGAGGQTPPRPDQQYAGPGQQSSGVAPGGNAILRAVELILSGTTPGLFLYVGNPALGNPPLVFISPQSEDPSGNAIAPNGVGVYNNDTGSPEWAFLSEGAANFATSLAAILGGYAGQIAAAAAGQLTISSGGRNNADPQATIVLGSANSSGGSSITSIESEKTVINVNGAPTPIAGISGSILNLPPDNNSGSTWVSGERAFMNNQWVAYINSNFEVIMTALSDAGIIT